MTTTHALLTEGIERLRAAGAETPRLDAEVLLGFAIGVDRTAILAHPEAPVGAVAEARFRDGLERRAGGEPVAYIRGIKEFHGLAFAVDGRALIPRPETERLADLLVAEVMQRLTAQARPVGWPPIRVVDVGTGSGAIAVVLAHELRSRRVNPEDVEIVAVDISPDALDLARENAVGHAVGDRLRFEGADLLPPLASAPWDVIAANLPYVRDDAMASLPLPTTFEPPLALDGGPDGLAVIARLLDRLPTALATDGLALLEIGADQGSAIVELVSEALPDWSCRVEADLAGLPRVAAIARPAS